MSLASVLERAVEMATPLVDQVRAVEAGFDCHLIKPVSVRDLVVLLDERVVGATTDAAGLRRPSRPD